MGLVDQVVSEADLESVADNIARDYAARDPDAFRSIKGLLRRAVAERMERTEKDSIEEFVRIWYSEKTWARLQGKTIHGISTNTSLKGKGTDQGEKKCQWSARQVKNQGRRGRDPKKISLRGGQGDAAIYLKVLNLSRP